jgi:sigma-B regulation protein RsbU (phosphoserine phosphatase)
MWLNDERTKFGIVVGDVSGKAMKAAMIAIMSNGMVFSKANELRTVKEIMTRLNHALYMKTDRVMFTALCFALIDVERRELTFGLAGINEPVLKRGAETVNLHATGTVLPLGSLAGSEYDERTITLQHRDVIVLYTDGISETMNKAGEFYDTEKLMRLLNASDTDALAAAEIRDMIVDAVRSYQGGARQQDDMTVVVIKCT